MAVITRNNTVHLETVSIGRDFGQVMQVLGGLSSRQQIIDNPPDGLKEGQKVNGVPEKAKKTSS